MRNYISQGLGRKQKLTQLVFWKRYLMKGLGRHTGLAGFGEPTGHVEAPRDQQQEDRTTPNPKRTGRENITIRVHLRARAWKGAGYAHCTTTAKQGGAGYIQPDPKLLSSQGPTPPLAEPNQKSKVKSPVGIPQRGAGSWSTEQGREGMKMDTVT